MYIDKFIEIIVELEYYFLSLACKGELKTIRLTNKLYMYINRKMGLHFLIQGHYTCKIISNVWEDYLLFEKNITFVLLVLTASFHL